MLPASRGAVAGSASSCALGLSVSLARSDVVRCAASASALVRGYKTRSLPGGGPRGKWEKGGFSPQKFSKRTMIKKENAARFRGRLRHAVNSVEVRQLVEKVVPCAVAWGKQKFGNYVIQDALDFGNKSQRANITSELTKAGVLAEWSTHANGSHVVKKLLSRADDYDRGAIVDDVVLPNLEAWACHQRASGVVCSAIASSEGRARDALIEASLPHAGSWAIDVDGAKVVKAMLDVSTPEQKSALAKAIVDVASELVRDLEGVLVLKKAVRVCDEATAQNIAQVAEKIAGESADDDASYAAKEISALASSKDRTAPESSPFVGESDASLPPAPPHVQRMLQEGQFSSKQRAIISATWNVPQECW